MINDEYYEELKNDFLERYDGNTGFDHPLYIEHERSYKDELVEVFREKVSNSLRPLSDDIQSRTVTANKAIHLFFEKLKTNANKVQNLVGFRYSNFLKSINAESKPEFAARLSNLLYGLDPQSARIDDFLDLLKTATPDPKYPYSSACGRSIFSFYLYLSNPDEHMFIRTQDLHNCLKALTGQGLDAAPSGEEYERVLTVVREVQTRLRADGWTPRDLTDIYTFLWLPWGDQLHSPGSFNPEAAEEYLRDRYELVRNPTQHVAGFETASGRQLALERTSKTVNLFLEDYPNDTEGVELIQHYALEDGRSSNLTSQAPQLAVGNVAVRVKIDSLQALSNLCDWYEGVTGSDVIGEIDMNAPLNTIMYGPPGTGKTYHTVNKALEILDPEFLEANNGDRPALKSRFDQLKEQGRIAMVTFHQSFSYEDFVEGLRADTDEEGNIRYRIRDGVFKTLCNRETVVSSRNFDRAVQDLQEKTLEASVQLKTATGKSFEVRYFGGSTFSINPASSLDKKYYPASIEHLRRLYLHGESEGMYNPSYVKGILQYLKIEYGLGDAVSSTDMGSSVLIIDEINRGNIANIFGELITLLEEGKRRNNAEELSITLPYSGDTLSVPNDLYVVGTMNTADRSLAVLDTALRRRFEFEAMYPNPALLAGVVVDGVNLSRLLETVNRRIAILYDREHLIGHSFFMGLKAESTIGDLRRVFEKHILPTLEEYFFEDWNRIRQVLGDHLKPLKSQFLIRQFTTGDIEKVLGADLAEEVGTDFFQRNPQALSDPQAYIGIYQPSTAETVDV